MLLSHDRLERIHNADIGILQMEHRLHESRLKRNNLTLLGSLPAEVLVMICKHLTDPTEPRVLSYFMGVCSHVYHAAVSASNLWTSLHWRQGISWREMCVDRSRGLPLHVHWRKRVLNANNQAYSEYWIYDVFDSSASATLEIPARALSDRPLDFLWASAPLLRILRLSSWPMSTPITRHLLGGQLQQLNVLELTNLKLCMHKDHNNETWFCPAMQNLTLDGCEMDIGDILFMIRVMPILEVLTIRNPDSIRPNATPTAVAGPVSLPHLHTLELEHIDKPTILSLLPLLPNPSWRFTIDVEPDGYHAYDAEVNKTVVSRLQHFWETVAGSRILPSWKVVVSITPQTGEDDDYKVECILTAATLQDESILQWDGSPSLFLSTTCHIDGVESAIFALVPTLEIQIGGYGIGLREIGLFDMDVFAGVQHIIISVYLGGDYRWHDDEQQLLEWVYERAAAGRALQTVIFKNTEGPIPEFTQKLVAAGGEDLRVIWE
jgi:hypothetical protein